MKSAAIAVVFVLSTAGCTCRPSLLERRIASYSTQHCKSVPSCTIDMRDIAPVQWDHMYVFRYDARLEDVQHALGVRRFDTYVEFARKIILTRAGAIVYQEQPCTNIESPTDGEAVFDPDPLDRVRSYASSDAIFSLTKVPFEKGRYFLMRRVSRGRPGRGTR